MRQLLNVFKIDNTLSWDVYVKCIAKKIVKKKELSMLRKVSYFMPPNAMF